MVIDRNSPIPQYFQLQSWLIEQIEQGIYKPDDRIPTEEEIVHLTGLARATIRQAIQNLVNMGYLFRRRRLGTFVREQNLNSNKQNIIGVLVHDLRSGYAPEFLRGVGDEAAKNNYSIILCNTDDLFTRADFHANLIIDHGITGIIFMPTAAAPEKNNLIIEKFKRKNLPVVLVDREIPGIDIDFVTTDNVNGAYELTRYLVRKGHKKIAITLSTLFSSERDRLEGYKKALIDHNLVVDPSIIFTTNERFVEKHYRQYARLILADKKKFTVIFAGNDPIAYIIYKVAQELKIAIPAELSLVGYDDLPFTNSHPVALTTVHQPIYEMGQESMKLLLSRINGKAGAPERIELKSRLIERGSVLAIK